MHQERGILVLRQIAWFHELHGEGFAQLKHLRLCLVPCARLDCTLLQKNLVHVDKRGCCTARTIYFIHISPPHKSNLRALWDLHLFFFNFLISLNSFSVWN